MKYYAKALVFTAMLLLITALYFRFVPPPKHLPTTHKLGELDVYVTTVDYTDRVCTFARGHDSLSVAISCIARVQVAR